MNSSKVQDAPAHGLEALTVLLAWIDGGAWLKSDSFGVQALLGEIDGVSLAQSLDEAGLSDWAGLAHWRNDAELQVDGRVQWLCAQAIERLAVAAVHPKLFAVVDNLQYWGEVSNCQIAASIASHVEGQPSDHPLVDAFAASLQTTYGSHYFERHRAYAAANPDAATRTRDLWPGPNDLPFGYDWAHQCVARFWPDRYMVELAAYPPAIQHAAISTLHDPDNSMIPTLIAASPRVYDDVGAPLGPAAMFALLDAAEAQIRKSCVNQAQTLPAELDPILLVIEARPDAEWIARAWLQQVLWRGASRRAGRSEVEMDAQLKITKGMMQALSAKIAPLGDWLTWVTAEEPLWRVDRVLVEGSALTLRDQHEAAARVLAKAIMAGVVTSNGRSHGLATITPEGIVIGAILGTINDPLAWFDTLWRETYATRERLSFPLHRNLDHPATPALAWAIQGLNCSFERPLDLSAWWRRLAEAVFETQQTDPNARLPDSEMTRIARFLALVGFSLVERGSLSDKVLAGFLADQLEPDEEHAFLWRVILANVPPDTVLRIGKLVGRGLLGLALQRGLAPSPRRRHAALFDDAIREKLLRLAEQL